MIILFDIILYWITSHGEFIRTYMEYNVLLSIMDIKVVNCYVQQMVEV